MKKLSISVKIILAITIILLTTTILSLYIQVRKQYVATLDLHQHQVNIIRTSNVISIQNYIWNVDLEKLKETLDSLVLLPSIEAVEVVVDEDPDQDIGRKVTQANQEKSSRNILHQMLWSYLSQLERGAEIVLTSPENPEKKIGVLKIFFNTAKIVNDLAKVLENIVFWQTLYFLITVASLLITIRYLVTTPLMQVSYFLEQLNLNALGHSSLKLEKRFFKDELDLVANGVNVLIEKIREHTKGLENLVREKTHDISIIMENINQGIFTVNSKLSIDNEHSDVCNLIFEEKNIVGKKIINLLEKTDLTSDELHSVESILTMCIQSDQFNYTMNYYNLPSGFRINDRKIIECEWIPIINDNQIITKMMLNLKDVTDLKNLQEKAKSSESELVKIQELVMSGQESFLNFQDLVIDLSVIEENAWHMIKEMNGGVVKAREMKFIHDLFRVYHTLKGTTRSYGYRELSASLHEIENHLNQWRSSSRVDNLSQALNGHKSYLSTLEQYDLIAKEKLGWGKEEEEGNQEESLIDSRYFSDLLLSIDRLESHVIGSEKYQVEWGLFKQKFASLYSTNLSEVLVFQLKSLDEMAERLGKKYPEIHIVENNIRIKNNKKRLFQNIFIHLFRNSLDHGLEDAQTRKKLGKKEAGKLSIKMTPTEHNIKIIYFDDGQGINPDFIFQRALEKGITFPRSEVTLQDKVNSIFHQGFSTAEEVTDISGRGVGMDAVKNFIEEKSGTININLCDKLETGHYSFEFEIFLPKDIFIIY